MKSILRRPGVSILRADEGLRAAIIGALLVLPLFFRLRGDVFRSDSMVLDSGGRLAEVPIPLAVPVCYVAVYLLVSWTRATLGTLLFVATSGCMAFTGVIAAGAAVIVPPKIVILAQFALPVVAFALGQALASDTARAGLARSFLAVLALIVPAQVALTVSREEYRVTHDLLLFSIYQHLQYVPVIFVAAYLFALYTLWRERLRSLPVVLAPFIAIQAAMSYSMLSGGLLVLGAGLFAVRVSTKRSIFVFVLTCSALLLTYWVVSGTNDFRSKAEPTYTQPKMTRIEALQVANDYLPENARSRLREWAIYAKGAAETPSAFLFGHAQPFSRTVSTSAHNYYLDFLYNFGLVAMLPLLSVLAYTLYLTARCGRMVWANKELVGLAFVALFLVVVDSSFKVTLRQPYPGIFAFLLWGLLVAELQKLRARSKPRPALQRRPVLPR